VTPHIVQPLRPGDGREDARSTIRFPANDKGLLSLRQSRDFRAQRNAMRPVLPFR